VKIISQGTRPPVPPPYLAPLTCRRCGTIFQLDEADIAPNWDQPEGDLWTMTRSDPSGGGLSGVCPGCHTRIAFTAKDFT
jgi:hypothetical protein